MKISNKNMRDEVNRRIDILKENLGLHPSASSSIKDDESSEIWTSRQTRFGGILSCYDLEMEDKETRPIKDYNWAKNQTGGEPYFIIYTNTEFGLMASVLFVTQYEEDWEEDRKDLQEGMAIALCRIEDETTGDMGTIGINGASGGLVRTF